MTFDLDITAQIPQAPTPIISDDWSNEEEDTFLSSYFGNEWLDDDEAEFIQDEENTGYLQ